MAAERVWNAGHWEPEVLRQRLREPRRHPSQSIHIIRESDEFRRDPYVLQSHLDPVSSCSMSKAADVRDTRCSEPALQSQRLSRSSESFFPLDDIGGDLVGPGFLSDDLLRFQGEAEAGDLVVSGSVRTTRTRL